MATINKTAKALNYTTEQEARLSEVYGANPSAESVATLAAEMGKAAKSVVAKLTRMGIYKKKEYTTKTGEKPTAKSAHAEAIGKVLNLSEPEVDSLTKANKTALSKIFGALANSVPLEATTPEQETAKAANVQTIARGIGLDPTEAGSLMRVKSGVLADLAAQFE